MSKALRRHAPGCVFHITARTQGKQPWFTDLVRPRIESEIMASAQMAGMTVFACVIMPNHFHIILRQGSQPLAYMMHRVMHRTASMLKRAIGMDGHVFGQPYWAGLIETAAYVRRAIVYAHLNPCRALLCPVPEGYTHSSHHHFLQSATQRFSAVDRDEALSFFAGFNGDDPLKQYLEQLHFQMSIDAYMRGELAANFLVPPPACVGGDLHWDENYRAAMQIAEHITPKQPIYDVARKLLERFDDGCSLDLIRTGLRSPRISHARRNLTAALLTAGYRGTQIARLMGMSTSAVSKIAASLRA
jgi:REP element-mobilizing transposase RayT